jgi:hypothetical protein
MEVQYNNYSRYCTVVEVERKIVAQILQEESGECLKQLIGYYYLIMIYIIVSHHPKHHLYRYSKAYS